MIGKKKYPLAIRNIIDINKSFLLIFTIKVWFLEKRHTLIGTQLKIQFSQRASDKWSRLEIKCNCRKEKIISVVFNITKFSNELLNDLENLVGWPEKVKLMQKNWIGKSYGCEISFEIFSSKDTINVFTTRPDTIFEQVL